MKTGNEPRQTEAEARAIRAARRSADYWRDRTRAALTAALEAAIDGRFGAAADLALTAANWAKCALFQRNRKEAETDGEA